MSPWLVQDQERCEFAPLAGEPPAKLVVVAHRQRPEEKFAEALLHRVLGVTITERDDNSRHRMVDALFRFPDGRLGALEVTTIGDQATMEQEYIAAKRDWYVEGSRWAWTVHANGHLSLRSLGDHLASIVLACERHEVTDPAAIGWQMRDDPAFQWLQSTDATFIGLPGSIHPGRVWVLPDGDGGFVPEHMDDLPPWLEQRLAEADMTSKLDKLRATGREEQHLFLRVHDTGMPHTLYDPLAFGDRLPQTPLNAPDALTGLWLVPQWTNPILWWAATTGWQREDCLD